MSDPHGQSFRLGCQAHLLEDGSNEDAQNCRRWNRRRPPLPGQACGWAPDLPGPSPMWSTARTSDAKAMIQQTGGSPVVATRTGDGLDESKCLVTNAWDAPYCELAFVRMVGMTTNNEVFVALNCNGELAGPRARPGNSAASPGRPAGKVRGRGEGRRARGAGTRRGGHAERVVARAVAAHAVRQ